MLAAGVTASTSGCTLVGLAVGSSVDRYRDVPREPVPPAPCERERAVLKPAAQASAGGVRPPAARSVKPAEVVARTPTGVVVRERDAVRPVEWTHVDFMQCRAGTYALHGAALGALADGAVLLTWIVYEVSRVEVGSTKF